jgi:hypothetical protein
MQSCSLLASMYQCHALFPAPSRTARVLVKPFLLLVITLMTQYVLRPSCLSCLVNVLGCGCQRRRIARTCNRGNMEKVAAFATEGSKARNLPRVITFNYSY